jgi:hypothetical protein
MFSSILWYSGLWRHVYPGDWIPTTQVTVLSPIFTCCNLLCIIQNSVFICVNIIIQVKVITKDIYINDNHDMFRPILGHHQVYLSVLRCWIFVQYGSIFFFIFGQWLLLNSEHLICLLFHFKPYWYKIKLTELKLVKINLKLNFAFEGRGGCSSESLVHVPD